MPKLLLLHHPPKGNLVAEELGEQFDDVVPVVVSEVDELIRHADVVLCDTEFDVVVFDINFPNEEFAGLRIFKELEKVRAGQWKHSILLTMYASSNPTEKEILASTDHVVSDSDRAYKFADENNIDRDNVIGPFTTGYRSLIDRIRAIIDEAK